MSATAFTTPMAITPTDASKPPPSAPGFSRSKIQIKPDRYAALLPPNYMDILPMDVKAAFAAEKFEWGKVPEWIPPKEVR
jgi:nucleoporin NUP42